LFINLNSVFRRGAKHRRGKVGELSTDKKHEEQPRFYNGFGFIRVHLCLSADNNFFARQRFCETFTCKLYFYLKKFYIIHSD